MIDPTFFAIQEMRNAFREVRIDMSRTYPPEILQLLARLENKMQVVLDRIGNKDYQHR